MANARRHKDSAEEQRIEAALGEYVTKAQKVPSVAGVAYINGPDRDLFTFIDQRDLDVMDLLQDIEDELFADFEDELFDYHVYYLEGRPFKDEVARGCRVIYERP